LNAKDVIFFSTDACRELIFQRAWEDRNMRREFVAVVLIVGVLAAFTATAAYLAVKMNLVSEQGRSLLIHAGGDNYADQPAPLGGGGARVACGVIK
jgi:hypothetical protein